jgi:hypothetical protein
MCIGINRVLLAGIALVLLGVLHRLSRQEGMESKPPDCTLFTNDESCKSRPTCDWTLKNGSYVDYECTKKEKK